jgi:hypothetical protein
MMTAMAATSTSHSGRANADTTIPMDTGDTLFSDFTTTRQTIAIEGIDDVNGDLGCKTASRGGRASRDPLCAVQRQMRRPVAASRSQWQVSESARRAVVRP